MTETEDSFLPHTPTTKKERRRSKNKLLRFLRRRPVIFGLLANVVLAYILVVILAALLGSKGKKGQQRQITVTKGAVVSDHEVCSKIGRNVLADGGSAVDAAIATLLCNGIMAPHSMGIGGGCFMVIYDAKDKTTLVIDGRETAPLASKQKVFENVTGYVGPMLIGVPGEIAAYWKAHQRYGKLPWNRLFQPSVDLLENGFHLSHSVERAMKRVLTYGRNVCEFKGLGDVFCDDQGSYLPEGSLVKWPKLANTYRNIGKLGPDYMYKGDVPKLMAKEITNMGGIITSDDFANYIVKESSGIEFDLGDMTLHTHGAPSGGPIMGLAMNILKGMHLNPEEMKDTKTEALIYHKIIEAIKFAYGERFKLGDADFVPGVKERVNKMTSQEFANHFRKRIDLTKTHEKDYYANETEPAKDGGTAHVSVVSQNGDAVSVTSTINTYFGSMMVSESTGIIWNNENADFSLHAKNNLDNLKSTVPNRIEPGKRPLSSMAPAIFVNKNEKSVKMVIGNAGGSKITTTNIQVAVRHLWLGQDLQDAVREKRFHHQLEPNVLVYEFGYPKDILKELERFGHKLKFQAAYMSVVQAISRKKRTGEITGFSDERKYPGRAMFYTTEEKVYF